MSTIFYANMRICKRSLTRQPYAATDFHSYPRHRQRDRARGVRLEWRYDARDYQDWFGRNGWRSCAAGQKVGIELPDFAGRQAGEKRDGRAGAVERARGGVGMPPCL